MAKFKASIGEGDRMPPTEQGYIDRNPWRVEPTPELAGYVKSLMKNKKYAENKVFWDFYESLIIVLETFPPDPKYFQNPQVWFFNEMYRTTMTHHGFIITVMAQYRYFERICVVVELTVSHP